MRDDDIIPFAAADEIMRFAADWAEADTRRELGMPYNVATIERFAIGTETTTTTTMQFESRFRAHWELNSLSNGLTPKTIQQFSVGA